MLIVYNNKEYKVSEYNEFNNYFSNVNFKKFSLELNYTDSDVIYGNIYDVSKQNVILLTDKIFTYDVIRKKYSEYKYNGNGRIMDFRIINNKIYYVELTQIEDSIFWNIIFSDLNFSEKKVMASGHIEDPFSFPKVFVKYDKIVFVYIDDISDEEQKYCIDILNKDNELLKNKCEYSKKNEKSGNMLYNILNTSFYKNDILYTIVDEKNNQILKKYNVNDYSDDNIYINDEDDYVVYNYIYGNNVYFIQMAKKNSDESKIIILDSKKKNIKKINSNLILMPIYYNDMIYFHNYDNSISVFNFNKLNLKKYKLNYENLYPRYVIVNNRLILKNSDNKFFYFDIKEIGD